MSMCHEKADVFLRLYSIRSTFNRFRKTAKCRFVPNDHHARSASAQASCLSAATTQIHLLIRRALINSTITLLELLARARLTILYLVGEKVLDASHILAAHGPLGFPAQRLNGV